MPNSLIMTTFLIGRKFCFFSGERSKYVRQKISEVIRSHNGELTYRKRAIEDADIKICISCEKENFYDLDQLHNFLLKRNKGLRVIDEEAIYNISRVAGKKNISFDEYLGKIPEKILLGLKFYLMPECPIIRKKIERCGGNVIESPKKCCIVLVSSVPNCRLMKSYNDCLVLSIRWLVDTVNNNSVMNYQEYVIHEDTQMPVRMKAYLKPNHKVYISEHIKNRIENIERYADIIAMEPHESRYVIDNFIQQSPCQDDNLSTHTRTILCLKELVRVPGIHYCPPTHAPMSLTPENIKMFSKKRFVLIIEEDDFALVVRNILLECGATIIDASSILQQLHHNRVDSKTMVIWDKVAHYETGIKLLKYGLKFVSADVFFHLITRPLVPHQLEVVKIKKPTFRPSWSMNPGPGEPASQVYGSGEFSNVVSKTSVDKNPDRLTTDPAAGDQNEHYFDSTEKQHYDDVMVDGSGTFAQQSSSTEHDIISDADSSNSNGNLGCSHGNSEKVLTTNFADFEECKFQKEVNELFVEKQVDMLLIHHFCSLNLELVDHQSILQTIFSAASPSTLVDFKGRFCSYYRTKNEHSVIIFTAILPNDPSVKQYVKRILGDILKVLILPLVVRDMDHQSMFYSCGRMDPFMIPIARLQYNGTLHQLEIYDSLNGLVAKNRPLSRVVMQTEIVVVTENTPDYISPSNYFPFRVVLLNSSDKLNELVYAACIKLFDDSMCKIQVNGIHGHTTGKLSSDTISTACQIYDRNAEKMMPLPIVFCEIHATSSNSVRLEQIDLNHDCYEPNCKRPGEFIKVAP